MEVAREANYEYGEIEYGFSRVLTEITGLLKKIPEVTCLKRIY